MGKVPLGPGGDYSPRWQAEAGYRDAEAHWEKHYAPYLLVSLLLLLLALAAFPPEKKPEA